MPSAVTTLYQGFFISVTFNGVSSDKYSIIDPSELFSAAVATRTRVLLRKEVEFDIEGEGLDITFDDEEVFDVP